MFCKYCGKELEEGAIVCAACGKDNGEQPAAKEQKEKKKIPVKNIVIICAVLVAAAVLIAVVMFALDGGFTPKANDIFYKESYTIDKDDTQVHMDKVIATMGEYQLTNGELQVYYWTQVVDFLNYYGAYVQYFGLDYSKPLDTQIMDEESGMTWQQYFLEESISAWHRYTLLSDKAQQAGFEMPEEYQTLLDEMYGSLEETAKNNGMSTVDELLQKEMGPGSTYEMYEKYMYTYYLGNLYFSELYEQQEVSTEELEAYFNEHADELSKQSGITKDSGALSDFHFILVKPDGGTKDADGNVVYTDDAWKAAQEKAQKIYDQWLTGEKTEQSFISTAEGLSEDKLVASGAEAYLPKYSEAAVDIRHVLICPEGGTKDSNGNTTYPEEEWEAALQNAQKLYDEWVASGADENGFIALAKEYSDDGNKDKGGIYLNVAKDYMVAEFDAWIFDESREYGDHGIVKTPFGYHLMFFIHGDREADNWVHDAARKPGEHTMVKTDDGYQIMYFVFREEGWIRYSEDGVRSEKSTKQLTDWLEENKPEINYKTIALAEHSLYSAS